jgi:hypothetical protein
VRLTDFWERMTATFGAHADSIAEMQVLTELDNRTVVQALADGEPTMRVWRAVCEGLEVPQKLR